MQEPSQASGTRIFKYDPKDITVSEDVQWASFDYYSGKAIIKELNLTQGKELRDFNTFLVCCGDIVILVESQELPHIERRII